MTWRVPKIWGGADCWIIGGGPSMLKQFEVPHGVIQEVMEGKAAPSVYSPFLAAIHNEHVIGVNMAFKIGNWIDIVFFGDKRWFLLNKKELVKFPGLKVTNHPHFLNGKYTNLDIKCVIRDKQHPKGISSRPTHASWNANSGAAAISIAAHTGVKGYFFWGLI